MRRAWDAFNPHDGLRQILIVLCAVWAYALARMMIYPNWPVAMANAQRVDNLERAFDFAWEQSLQRAFLGVPVGVLYPLAVVLTIVVTGNHFIFDALAGAAVLAAGFLVAKLLRIGRRALSYT